MAYLGGPDDWPELADIPRMARRLIRRAVLAARADDEPVQRVLREHLGPDAASLPVVCGSWQGYDQVNVQAGLDAWLAGWRREHVLVGLTGFTHRKLRACRPAAARGRAHVPRCRQRGDGGAAVRPGRTDDGLCAVRPLPGRRRRHPARAAAARTRRPRPGRERHARGRLRRPGGGPAGGRRGAAAGGRPERVPRAGDLVRRRDVRPRPRQRRRAALPRAAAPAPGHGGAPARCARRHRTPGDRGGQARWPAAGQRPAPQARRAAARLAGNRQDPHDPLPARAAGRRDRGDPLGPRAALDR